MKKQMTFNGTGAAVFLCLGMIPSKVKITSAKTGAWLEWTRNHRAAEADNGVIVTTAPALSLLTAGLGVEPYEGGDVLDSSLQTSVAYGEGVYLAEDPRIDYSKFDPTGLLGSYGPASMTIDKWTLDTAGNRTGHFNDDSVSSGNRIGIGSIVTIDEAPGIGRRIKQAVVEAWTAGQGISADEVTLSRAIGSGKVLSISGRYDMAPLAIGKVTPAGIKLNATTSVNVNNEINVIEFED
jgi:hypothetical protein